MAKKNTPKPLLVFCVFNDKWHRGPVIYFTTPEHLENGGLVCDCITGEAAELIEKLTDKYHLGNLEESTYESSSLHTPDEIIKALSKEPGVAFDSKFSMRLKRDIEGVIENPQPPLLVFCAVSDKEFNGKTVIYFSSYKDWRKEHHQGDGYIGGKAGKLIDKLTRKYQLGGELMENTYLCKDTRTPNEITLAFHDEDGIVFDKEFADFIKKCCKY